ncbi:MAG: TraY domain-containing protein [Deltaproteobacteria bacterium]|nr:TraY domain-containing protein [Deltaproteobacteria bacterium]
MSKVLNIRLPDDIAERLEFLAARTNRPKSFYVKEIIMKHLEEYEDAYLALERLNNKNAKYYSTEDVEKVLEL